MGKLKLSSNLFLEVQELERYRNFIEDNGYRKLCDAIIKSYGIVLKNVNSFKVTNQANSNTQVIVSAGTAYTRYLERIYMPDELTLEVQNTGSTRWVILSRGVSNLEEGTVSVTADGLVTGAGTKFTEVLRGQSNFPVKIRFQSSINTSDYEVSEVSSDTEAIVSGLLTAESDVRYSVIGAFTPGFAPLDENAQIYEFDGYNITIVDGGSAPGIIWGEQFMLASLQHTSLGIVVTDLRENYAFNSEDSSGIAKPTTNRLVSLLSAKKYGTNTLDLQIEHGYTVNEFETVISTQNNIFRILTGSCNLYGTGDLPDGLFRGWQIVNLSNMRRCTVSESFNKDLYSNDYSNSILNGSNNRFVVVPNYYEIEYSLEPEDATQPIMFCRCRIEDVKGRINVPIKTGDQVVKLQWRMIQANESTAFQDFSLSSYSDINGQTNVLGNSTLNVTI